MTAMLTPLIAILWLASATLDYSEYTYLWQLKGYLWRRFRDFLSTHQGKRYFAGYRILGRSTVGITLVFLIAYDVVTRDAALVVFFGLDAVYNIIRFAKRSLRYPTLTTTSFGLIALSIVGELILSSFVQSGEWLILLSLLRFVIIGALIALLYIPRELLARLYIGRAKAKLMSYS